MHLQQTKRESRATGGPQYYFHDLPESVKVYLRKKGAVPSAKEIWQRRVVARPGPLRLS